MAEVLRSPFGSKEHARDLLAGGALLIPSAIFLVVKLIGAFRLDGLQMDWGRGGVCFANCHATNCSVTLQGRGFLVARMEAGWS